jgi:hypothetical protein
MTRKQALRRAINFLSKHPEYEEDIRILQEISDELPLIHWSDSSIRDTVEQFILDNGRVPTTSDFKKKGMPPHPVIKQKYNVTLGEWLKQNYATRKPTQNERMDTYTKDFVEDYNRIKPRNQKEFNQNKCPWTKSWQTIAKYHGVRSWHTLLDALELPTYSKKPKETSPPDIKIQFFIDCDFGEDL